MAPQLSPSKRARIRELRDQHWLNIQIAKKFAVHKSTIGRMLHKMDLHDDPYFVTPGRGRPPIIDKDDILYARRKFKGGFWKDGADAQREHYTRAGASTWRRKLAEAGLHGRVRRKKPMLTKKHIRTRRAWAEAHRYWVPTDWAKCVFSDESKFNIIGSDGKRYTRRGPNEEFHPLHVDSRVKHGGGSVMVWGVITPNGVGRLHRVDGIMDAVKYIGILESSLLPTISDLDKSPGEVILVQDNDPKHKAKKTAAWLEENELVTMDWPPNSPDMNIIEHVWDELDRRVRRRGHLPTSKDNLWEILEEEWDCLPVSYIQKLYASMPERVEVLRQAKGNHTRY